MKTLILIALLFTSESMSKRGEFLCSINNNKVSIYYNRIWDDAEYVCNKYKIPMSVLFSQAALESGWGMSNLAINKCNHLGIKKKGEYRDFSSRRACFEKWAKVLHQNCYNNLQPKSFDDWVNALECCGYARSEHYKYKLRIIYKKDNLEILDA